MKKLRFLVTMAGPNVFRLSGAVYEVEEAEAARIVASGYAEYEAEPEAETAADPRPLKAEKSVRKITRK